MTKLVDHTSPRKSCKPGSHQWSEWEYVAENSCTEQTICSQCNGTRLRTASHAWGEWVYVRDNLCDQKILCLRCGDNKETRVLHRWGEWKYLSENLCDQKRSCLQCGEEDAQVMHVWGKWEYVSENLCDMKKTCMRCGDSYTDGRAEHVWAIVGESKRTERFLAKGPGLSFDADRFEVERVMKDIYHECSRCKQEKTEEVFISETEIE